LLLWLAWLPYRMRCSPSRLDRRSSTVCARHRAEVGYLIIKTNTRPTICFLCLRNPALLICERTASYATPGPLSRHFLRKHVRKLEEWEPIDYQICNVRLEHRQHLQSHAKKFHRTVSQRNA
jgi:hypothetical protein